MRGTRKVLEETVRSGRGGQRQMKVGGRTGRGENHVNFAKKTKIPGKWVRGWEANERGLRGKGRKGRVLSGGRWVT